MSLIRDNKEKIKGLLMDTEREGMESLIEYMEAHGFFTAPCSGGHHLAKEGGLAEHSLNVFYAMDDLTTALYVQGYRNILFSITICAILHDLGKMGDYEKPNYIPNMVDSRKKDADGNNAFKQSESKPYKTNPELLYVPHEVRSIAIAERFIRLTEAEEFAILYHNGLYGDFKYDIQGKETPLYLLLHMADMWCSRVVEIKESEEK